MHRDYFFGYGSLVNRRTHGFPDGRPAQLRGWRRVWRDTPGTGQALLSVHERGAGTISGLVAAVPDRDWRALDLREQGYARHPLTRGIAHDLHEDTAVQVYAVPGPADPDGGPAPILLSYLDVVVQGFLHEFGPNGAEDFFATTDGWTRPVLDDRSAPRYPRHQRLTDAERARVDAHLARLPVVVSHRE